MVLRSDLCQGNGQFKIPNLEVMTDWARWIIGDTSSNYILETCVEGQVSDFATGWPKYMQQQLAPKRGEARGAVSHEAQERIYRVLFWSLMQSLNVKGWEVSIEPRAGAGYTDIRLCHRRKGMAVLIVLKSSKKQGDMERDADRALKQIEEKTYRNSSGLPNICILREYGIACFRLRSYVKGRYLELDGQNHWVEKDDSMMSS